MESSSFVVMVKTLKKSPSTSSRKRPVLGHGQRQSQIHGHFFLLFPFPPSLSLLPSFVLTTTSSRTFSSLYIALSTSACLTDTYVSTEQKVICPNTSENPPAYLPQKNNTAYHLGIQSGDHGNTNFFLCVHPHIQPITKAFPLSVGNIPPSCPLPVCTVTTYAWAWTIVPGLAILAPAPLASNLFSTLSQGDSSKMNK